MKIDLTTKLLIAVCLWCMWTGVSHAQQISGVDVLPDTNSADSTAVLNNTLRQNQNAINAIGGYFSASGALGVGNGGTGATTLTGILQGNGISPVTAITLSGSSNDFLNGTGVFSSFGHGSQLFTTSGTFTAPSGITKVFLTGIGAGGGGSGCNGGSGGGGGGGSGSYIVLLPYVVTPLSSYTVTLNSGGSGSVNENIDASSGGTTIFDTIVLNGGGGGTGSGSGNNGGAGGIGTANGFNASASVSTASSIGGGFYYAGGNGAKVGASNSGGGGGSPFGSGANGVATANAGIDGTPNSGSGASGAFCPSASGGISLSGGNGAKGFILVQY